MRSRDLQCDRYFKECIRLLFTSDICWKRTGFTSIIWSQFIEFFHITSLNTTLFCCIATIKCTAPSNKLLQLAKSHSCNIKHNFGSCQSDNLLWISKVRANQYFFKKMLELWIVLCCDHHNAVSLFLTRYCQSVLLDLQCDWLQYHSS